MFARTPRRLALATTLCLVASPAALAAPAPQDPVIPEDTEIITTESGLQYSVLQAGNGEEFPAWGDRVKVHYSGWLTDGTLFDSSIPRGAPSEFNVGQVIEGWNEGLALMSPGAKFKLTIPYALGYGEAGKPPRIGPKADLIFEVELLEIPAKVLPYQAWADGEGVVTTESGLQYRVLTAGNGVAAKDADLVALEYALYDEAGKPLLSSCQAGGPLMNKAANMPLEFLKEATALMKGGDVVQLMVPPALAFTQGAPQGIDAEKPTHWQLQVKRAMKFETPEFVLPPDEELTETPSGLKYKVLREGSGKTPSQQNRATVHYTGWLTDGSKFDSSYDRGEPATFGVTQVIAGWTEGLQLMEEGAKYLLVIPSAIGYGERGSPPNIPGGATLVFIVELISVQ